MKSNRGGEPTQSVAEVSTQVDPNRRPVLVVPSRSVAVTVR